MDKNSVLSFFKNGGSTHLDQTLGFRILLTVLCVGILIFPKEKTFEITFLDVGQGDGIYISTGDGTTYFIDGGSSNVDSVGEYRMLPFLKYKGVAQIDYWFVSHADTDHISGLMEVLESGYRIHHLVVSADCPKDENYESLAALAEDMGTEIIHMKAGERIVSTASTMTCLYPMEQNTEDRNDLSMVLLFQHELDMTENKEKNLKEVADKGGKFSALFTGDCSAEVEQELVEQLLDYENGQLSQVDLFKAAHHGSNYSNSEELLSVLKPKMIVVSCSSTNNYGHPGAQAVERMNEVGAELFYTMESGQISILGKGYAKLFISADFDLD